MILVLGGTLDSRILTDLLLEEGRAVCYSSVTNIATDQMSENPLLTKISGQLDASTLRENLTIYNISLCIDATHPYAREISENAIWACEALNIDYIRLERPSHIDDGEDIMAYQTYEEARDYLIGAMGKSDRNILLTTGSRQLEAFEGLPKERTYIRVLPTAGVLSKCETLGYKPRHILALQGPFSVAMNVATMKEYKIGFIVTKDSGDVGGIKEKVAAARQVNAKILFIKRPVIAYPKVVSAVEDVIIYALKKTSKVIC
ncbi:precorrin-6A reductase [Acetobacterium woodii]|uniref:Precorrin-6A reductase CbiJ2 n=1 Tax=Acetobacterium woodii (strain ATCC 29683 / DSM 1030 / JCM 2381 / KCTC 1655 / WB1) TaxID=931626 RepID=H6LI50_ACEWD|nr:precorrin-6A reductase [Acetobacterium woodii]AFA49750.1 precorrin-6A reductase CbiJ2 [Acetobacterium woodii DSM 1030]